MGGRHAHRPLSPHERGFLSAWKYRLCIEQHPVTEIAAPPWTPGGGSVGNTTLSTRIRRSQGSRGTQSRETKTWQTTPPAATEQKSEENIETMKQAAIATSTPVPQTADGHPFCLSYHLKGVCNSNCGGRHAHRPLSPHERGILSAWKYRLCIEQHPVTEIAPPPLDPMGGLSRKHHALN